MTFSKKLSLLIILTLLFNSKIDCSLTDSKEIDRVYEVFLKEATNKRKLRKKQAAINDFLAKQAATRRKLEIAADKLKEQLALCELPKDKAIQKKSDILKDVSTIEDERTRQSERERNKAFWLEIWLIEEMKKQRKREQSGIGSIVSTRTNHDPDGW
ncbi:hypothetical protein KBC04_00200 [Candidatus Babeliales bacterium]|nr:hypothetical protein [Candidatus Babeliales bacterium]MBP9843488.1 hypothetical protein [Candidatus Babeliales bacterium]